MRQEFPDWNPGGFSASVTLPVKLLFCDLAGRSGQVILLPRFSQGPYTRADFCLTVFADAAPSRGAGRLPVLILFSALASMGVRGEELQANSGGCLACSGRSENLSHKGGNQKEVLPVSARGSSPRSLLPGLDVLPCPPQ